jgi:hypothetical protein
MKSASFFISFIHTLNFAAKLYTFYSILFYYILSFRTRAFHFQCINVHFFLFVYITNEILDFLFADDA